MRVYFINLDRRTDRRAGMEGQLSRLGITAERVPAITPDQITNSQRKLYCNPANRLWMTDVELCCSLSHIRTLEKFLASDVGYATILEDDAILSPLLPNFLSSLEKRNDAPDLLRLETDLSGQRLMPQCEARIGKVEIRQSWSWCAGSAAYVVSKRGARLIVDSGYLLRFPADEALFNPYKAVSRRLMMRHCFPGLAVQSDLINRSKRDSDISTARSNREVLSAPHRYRSLMNSLTGMVETELIYGSQRQFHTLFGGARKTPVPFAAE